MTLYVVAVSKKEAEMLASAIGHTSRRAAEEHLAEVKAPPTDPCYAYKVWEVTVAHAPTQETPR